MVTLQAMAAEGTSPACVEIYSEVDSVPTRHRLGFSVTSAADDVDRYNGCYTENGTDGLRCADDSSSSRPNSSSMSDYVNGEAPRRVHIHYKHVVSHVEHTSPLKRYLG